MADAFHDTTDSEGSPKEEVKYIEAHKERNLPETHIPVMAEADRKMKNKRDNVIAEIISTEKTYVERLQAVMDVYVVPCRLSGSLSAKDIVDQFGYWDVILGVHTELFESMHKQNAMGTLKIGELFERFTHYLKVYKEYLVNYTPALTKRGELMTKNKKFVDLVEKGQMDPRSAGQNLESLLVGPVQRIPRYKMLLEQVLKYTKKDDPEYAIIEGSLQKICDSASENNEAIRERENMEAIMDIMLKIVSDRRVNLLDDPKRRLIRSGTLLRQTRSGSKPFVFWLFSDKLLYGDRAKNLFGTEKYYLHRDLNVSECFIQEPAEDTENRACAIFIESPNKSFIVWAADETEKRMWIDDFEMVVKASSDDSPRDRSSMRIAPLLRQMSSVKNCKLCNQGFSMIAPKFHCSNCGGIFCDSCSAFRVLLPHIDPEKKVRIHTMFK
jgi:hypothetical protein